MRRTLALAVAAVAATAILIFPAVAGGEKKFQAKLVGFQEVPAISTVATGEFTAKLNQQGTELEFELSYQDLESDATQAHLHFGQKSVNGGISVWLCSNLASPPTPPGTQACPLRSGTVTGTIGASNVVGPGGQGIQPMEFAELLRALRSGVVYANVHSSTFGGGEIRGQV